MSIQSRWLLEKAVSLRFFLDTDWRGLTGIVEWIVEMALLTVFQMASEAIRGAICLGVQVSPDNFS